MTGRPERVAILAGGRASRMGGTPKGLLDIGGRRILDRVVDAAAAAFGTPPILVANDPGAPSWRSDLVVVPDRIREAGTLGGIHAALTAVGGAIVCVAWDMPFVTAPLLRRLADDLDQFDVVIPTSGGPRGVEPLCAGYGPACRAPIEAAIRRGDHRAIGFHDTLRVAVLDPAVVATFGDPTLLFFNVNTPEDLTEAERLAGLPPR